MRGLISTGSPFEPTMGYSRAVVLGDWCFMSGATGYDYASMSLPADVDEQLTNCFKTIFNVLAEADFLPERICKVHCVLANRFFPIVASLLGHHLGSVRPAATMVIAGLVEPEMLIEIDGTAFKG